MGHIQKMTDHQRFEFLSQKYKATKEARRGVNGTYLNEKSFNDLMEKGYRYYVFENGKIEVPFRHVAQEQVEEMRNNGCFARVIVNPCHNIKGAQTYSVLWKRKAKS